jgi:uncharacterized protein
VKRPALVLLACLFFASTSFAQQNDADAPASKPDIERYLDAMHSRDMTKNMMATMATQTQKMIHDLVTRQPNLPPDFEARMDKTMNDYWSDVPVDDIIDAMIPVYQKHLTKGDVDVLVAFYSGPTGQKVLKEMPAITSESMQAASGIVQKMVAKAMQRVDDEIAQVQKANDGKPADAKTDDGKTGKQSPATPN